MKRVHAYFQPQVWIFDSATDTGLPKKFDVTDALMQMGEEKARKLRSNTDEGDLLAPDSLVDDHLRKYGEEACYYVDGTEEAVETLFGQEGEARA